MALFGKLALLTKAKEPMSADCCTRENEVAEAGDRPQDRSASRGARWVSPQMDSNQARWVSPQMDRMCSNQGSRVSPQMDRMCSNQGSRHRGKGSRLFGRKLAVGEGLLEGREELNLARIVQPICSASTVRRQLASDVVVCTPYLR